MGNVFCLGNKPFAPCLVQVFCCCFVFCVEVRAEYFVMKGDAYLYLDAHPHGCIRVTWMYTCILTRMSILVSSRACRCACLQKLKPECKQRDIEAFNIHRHAHGAPNCRKTKTRNIWMSYLTHAPNSKKIREQKHMDKSSRR